MNTFEWLINDLNGKILQLEDLLKESEQATKDFEKLAQTWKSAYDEETWKLKTKIKNLETVIEEQERELNNAD